ncbi:hypothetical protein P689_119241 [Candidatus Riesia pediculischaeffi PTSU]|uniref:DedA family protein n=1 Tax=Candidatus Riesia pediculischaeffi PTSU TaxID=1401651 RepID=A0A0C1VK87_9ENTR|nr:hypothetical protein P689_119241 [Candidatus Riesia pediculischaeffi PTSU]
MADHILLKIQSNPNWIVCSIFLISLGKSIILISTLLPPAYITLLALIILANEHLNNNITIWITITIGSFLGSIICHFFGYMMCSSRTKKLNFIFKKYDIKIRRIKLFLKDQGKLFYIIFLSRFVAVFRYLVPFVSGMMNIQKIHKNLFFYFFSSSIWSFFLIITSNFIVNFTSI